MRENQQTQQTQRNSEQRTMDIKQSQGDLKIIYSKHAIMERNKIHESKKENKMKEHDTKGGTIKILKIQLNS